KPEECVLTPSRRDELHADWETAGAPVQRQRYRGLAGDVPREAERHETDDAHDQCERVALCLNGEVAEHGGRFGAHRCNQDVVTVREPCSDIARPALYGLDAGKPLCTGDRSAHFGEECVGGLELVELDRPGKHCAPTVD